MAVGTRMGNGKECPRCERDVHTNGMIGGGWRVEGVGGPEHLELTVETRPGTRASEGFRTQITVDRDGVVIAVRRSGPSRSYGD